MEFITMGITVAGAMSFAVIGGVLFYIKSIKYFQPSEILAISQFRRNTGNIDVNGEPIYSDYTYQRGGRKFIPFWKEYYVLPTHLMTSSIATQKFLTLDKVHIRADFVVQYQIDVSTPEKIEEAFSIFADLVKYKNTNAEESNISKIFSSHFEKLFKGIIPEVLGKRNIDELIEQRERVSKTVLNRIREDFSENGLAISALKIETIHIENKAYFDKLEQTIAERQEVELAKEQNRTKNEKAKLKKDEIRRELENKAEQFKLDYAEIKFNANIKRKKIKENKLLQDSHKEEEEYNKSLILSQKRAEKDAELVLKKIELQIAELVNKTKIIENERKAKNIKAINEAMKDTNGFASLLIVLEENPSLIKQLFGKGGLSKLANNMTKHLASIDSVTIADMGGSNGGSSLEKFALLIPTIFSQTISKINKVGISQTMSDMGIDKESINKMKKNKNFKKMAKNMGKKAGLDEDKVDEFYKNEENSSTQKENKDKDEEVAKDEMKKESFENNNEDINNKEETPSTNKFNIKKWFTKKSSIDEVDGQNTDTKE